MENEKVKISTLSKDTVVIVEDYTTVNTVEEILEDLDFYRGKEIYTTVERKAYFNAEEILDSAIEDEQCNGMYEDWDDSVRGDITQEDIDELQAIFDRILARSPKQNTTWESVDLIEIDI